jgi:hypothetical protein
MAELHSQSSTLLAGGLIEGVADVKVTRAEAGRAVRETRH